ncbi:uncharacterized protein ARMOST_02344 [Armillaria ostoyae]|uniref:Uncharacterized protein n=1 Tax=Armillaria ostoyae TaxID=47428 RepID=A0A284QRE5_ARMOS|nr:uncharacterized protein ARMOST_02344 [Armillaria ostoyae]
MAAAEEPTLHRCITDSNGEQIVTNLPISPPPAAKKPRLGDGRLRAISRAASSPANFPVLIHIRVHSTASSVSIFPMQQPQSETPLSIPPLDHSRDLISVMTEMDRRKEGLSGSEYDGESEQSQRGYQS